MSNVNAVRSSTAALKSAAVNMREIVERIGYVAQAASVRVYTPVLRQNRYGKVQCDQQDRPGRCNAAVELAERVRRKRRDGPG